MKIDFQQNWIPTRHWGEQASRKPLGQKGSKKTQCKMSAGQRTLIPHFFSLVLRPRPHFFTLCNCGGLPASIRTVKNGNHTVGTYRLTQNVSPWLYLHGTLSGRAMACQTYLSRSSTSSRSLLLERYFPKAGRPQQKVFHHPTDTVVRQRDLCGKSSFHTRAGVTGVV